MQYTRPLYPLGTPYNIPSQLPYDFSSYKISCEAGIHEVYTSRNTLASRVSTMMILSSRKYSSDVYLSILIDVSTMML